MARPKIEIDKQLFENLCAIFCTLEEISSVMNCSEDTIERWCKREYKESFADIYKKKSSKGRASLRRTQFKMAETNVTMSIWLGKQYLGQRDKIEQTGDETSLDILNEIADEIKKAKEYERTEQKRGNSVPS